MKYQLTSEEIKKINTGEIITFPCYKADDGALCEFICEKLALKARFKQSESPTGRHIFIFFFYPTTFYQGYRIGGILENPSLWKDELTSIPQWENRFQRITTLATLTF
jgi:hypothetical protein